jgi:hypothetical protein
MTYEEDKGRDAEFSRPLAAAEVPEEGLDVHVAARADECLALAAADGLTALTRLEADLRVRRESAGGLRVEGELRADLRQTCVVTLEEFDVTLVEPIDVAFTPERAPRIVTEPSRRSRRADAVEEQSSGSHSVDLEGDAPDPMIDGRIDLGAIVAEFLALALDPYPRKPGASFTAPDPADESAQVRSPFARLGDALRKGRGN